jgi:hypothetical protein
MEVTPRTAAAQLVALHLSLPLRKHDTLSFVDKGVKNILGVGEDVAASLRKLDLSRNPELESLAGLHDVVSLTFLKAADCGLRSRALSEVGFMKELSVFHASGNRIDSFPSSSFRGCVVLKVRQR